jgi:hypothetical protein
MSRDTRRGIRVAGGILNIVIQILMLWIIVRSLDVRSVESPDQVLITIKSMLTHISIMMGTFFVYFALVNLVTRRNISGHKGGGE